MARIFSTVKTMKIKRNWDLTVWKFLERLHNPQSKGYSTTSIYNKLDVANHETSRWVYNNIVSRIRHGLA
ncbi:Hypothetical protein PHPALM_18632 [Phytophthora palmivora]|uniref:Uncharacterized protein n=1 Tax=Phytophthora palmivora TaxID=4796 RepID=A0A2P4XJ85_9STRA|nr:Hypothetical protein PHPALM_18632 [Phytophthora palmivora]